VLDQPGYPVASQKQRLKNLAEIFMPFGLLRALLRASYLFCSGKQADTVTFWSVGVEEERETSHNPECPVWVIFGLRRSLNEKHR
jgi:hypothetical protein